MNILITSGGTKVPIDRVRHIANMSSGTFGSKIAYESLKADHNVHFFYAKDSKTPFAIRKNLLKITTLNDSLREIQNLYNDFIKYYQNYQETTYEDFNSYFAKLEKLIKESSPDVIVLAAAVSDYGVDNYVDGKIRSNDNLNIRLKLLPKVISKVKEWAPKSLLVGFKLLVDSTDETLIENAQKSIKENGCDMVVANDLRDIKNNAHKLIIVKSDSYHTYHSVDGSPNHLAKMLVKEIELLKEFK